MKLYNKLVILGLMIFAASCGNEYDIDENFDLEELPGYVAFFADGNSINVDAVDLGEDGGTVEVVVHSPVEILSDVTVTYDLGGTAVEGTDFTIEGTSGVMTISADRGNFAETYRGSIVINGLNNTVFEGNKTIVLTLTGASNAEGEIEVGRGGKDFQKVAVVNLLDDECDSQFAGDYEAYSIIDSIVVDGMLMDTVIVSDTTNVSLAKMSGEFFSYSIDDISSSAFDVLGGAELSYNFVEDCRAISAEGQEDDLGRTFNLVSGRINDNGIVIITLKNSENGEQFRSILTPDE